MASKRSHTKSRLGCKQCKKRRIKCDEVAPCCGSCAHKGIACDYQAWQGACDNVQLFTPSIYSNRRPSHAAASRPSPPETTPSASGSVSLSGDSAASESFSLEDLGLLHYFTIHTSYTVGQQDTEQYRWIWQQEVPRLAQNNRFLMHAVLGCAAADRAQSESVGDARYADWNQARYHYDRAINFFREAFEEISAEKADAFLCFALLVMLLTVCLDSQCPTRQRNPVDTFVNLVETVHRSVKALDLVRHELQNSVIGRCLMPGRPKGPTHALEEEVVQAMTVLEGLTDRYNAVTHHATADVLANALAKLRMFYTQTESRPKEWVSILSWVVKVEPALTLAIEQGHPIALCMAGHWCVAAANAPRRWHTGTWPKALILNISQRLQGSEWAQGMEWPLGASMVGVESQSQDYDFAAIPPGFDVDGTIARHLSQEELDVSVWAPGGG